MTRLLTVAAIIDADDSLANTPSTPSKPIPKQTLPNQPALLGMMGVGWVVGRGGSESPRGEGLPEGLNELAVRWPAALALGWAERSAPGGPDSMEE